jgi:hypothetical protein
VFLPHKLRLKHLNKRLRKLSHNLQTQHRLLKLLHQHPLLKNNITLLIIKALILGCSHSKIKVFF